MKRYFYLLGLIGISAMLFYLLANDSKTIDHPSADESLGPSGSTTPHASQPQTAAPAPVPPSLPSGQLTSERSGSTSNAATPSAEETHRADDLAFAKSMYDSFFESFHQTFGAGAVTVIGKVTLSYGGYEGKYETRFLLPSRNPKARVGIPIYTAGVSDPTSGYIGSGWVVPPGSRQPGVKVTELGFVTHTMFKKKAAFDALSPAERELDPNAIKGVVYTVEPTKKKGSSEVFGWLDFIAYEDGPPTVSIGKMEYVVLDGLVSADAAPGISKP